MDFHPQITKRWAIVAAFLLASAGLCTTSQAQGDDPVDAPANPVAVAVLSFDCNLEEPKEAGRMLAEILSARLAGEGDFIVVERQAIEKVLDEHKLALSGLISPDQAATFGQLTGAQLLVTGRVIVSGDQQYIVSKVISVRTGQLKGFFLSLPKDTPFADIVDRVGEKLGVSLADWAGPLTDDGNNAASLTEILTHLFEGKTAPVVAVQVAEQHIGPAVIDPAVETELKHLLAEAGAEVRAIPREVSEEIASGVKDFPRLARQLDGARYLIVGEAISENGGSIFGLSVAIARTELQIIDLSNGTVIVADRTTTRAPDLSENLAAKTALQKAGNELARRMLPAWIETLEEKPQVQ
jgi:TolB-like protein